MWCVCFFIVLFCFCCLNFVVVWTGIHYLVGEFETRRNVNCSLVGITVAESTSPPFFKIIFCCCWHSSILPLSPLLSLVKLVRTSQQNKTRRKLCDVKARRLRPWSEKILWLHLHTLRNLHTRENHSFSCDCKASCARDSTRRFFSLVGIRSFFLLSLFLLIKRQEQLHKPYVYHGMTASKPLASARQPLHAWTTHTINQINHHYNSIL